MNKKVSIIVPCYNAEKYIERCVKSLEDQTYQDVEIILVDDGSKDNTAAVIEKLAKNDSRIKFLSQRNSGPNAARGNGIKRATGDYVMFIDSDDWLSQNAVSELVKLFDKNGVDVIKFNAITEPSKRKLGKIISDNEGSRTIENKEILKMLLSSDRLNNLCFQIYKRELFNSDEIFSAKIVHGEDYLANIYIHQNTKKMLIVNNTYYHYFDNLDSCTKSADAAIVVSNIRDLDIVHKKIIAESKKHGFTDDERARILFSILDRYRYKVFTLFRDKKLSREKFTSVLEEIYASDPFKTVVKELDGHKFKKCLSELDWKHRLKNKNILRCLYKKDTSKLWSMRGLYRVVITARGGR